ncbi:hypothetical protein M885DRAFT_102716 [Pelagophyceae sp. CCMP2097]|nr:hypothetical protein M885DRAFT_102716 [Pelagophyceae sp. CCMP2097]
MAAADDDDEDDDSTPGDETAVDLGADVLSQAVLGPCVDGIGCTVTAVIDAALPLCVGDVLQTLAGDDVSKQDFPIILQQLKEGPKPLASTWRRRGDEAPDGDEATDGGDPSPTVAEGGMSVKLLAAMPSLASAALAIPKGVSLRNMGAISGRTLDYGRAAVTSARKSYDAQRGRSLEPNFASSLAADSPQTPDADDAATDSGAAASAPPDAPSRRRGDAAVPAAGDAAAAQQQAHSFAEQRCVDLERSLVAARNKLATTESKLSVRENKLEQAAATRQKLEAKLATARAGLDEAAAAGDAQRVVAAADAALVLGAARAEADQIRADAEQQTSKLRADTDAAAATHRAALGEAQWQLQDTQVRQTAAVAEPERGRRRRSHDSVECRAVPRTNSARLAPISKSAAERTTT